MSAASPAPRFALIDGAAFGHRCGYPLAARQGVEPLFDPAGSDADLMAVGCWMVALEHASVSLRADIDALEHRAPAVTRFDTLADVQALLPHLRSHLDAELPDGRIALLRFYDPRVLAALASVLDADQWADLCGPITRWQVQLDGHARSFRGNDVAAD